MRSNDLFVVQAPKNSDFYWFAKRAVENNIVGGVPERDSAADIMRRALSFDTGSAYVAITNTAFVVGACRWRDTDKGTQRCLTAVYDGWERRGIGNLLVKAICQARPDNPMWSKALPQAWVWCDSLGMHCVETLPDGRRVYEWSAEEVRAFADA
jgi:hypothetical protein